ncbi:MAG TPA: DUF4396 domain-containing protein [Streptosporangiaceae bacterium]|nr:DUF4396 domain-containing protein [Streptosporangiaceae bacterium]
MAPDWLTAVAWAYLSVCFACAAAIAYDIAGNHRRQPMGVMNAVYPITALYLGPFALAFYWRWGRAARLTTPTAHTAIERAGESQMALAPAAVSSWPAAPAEVAEPGKQGKPDEPGKPGEAGKPRWVMMATEVSHCGAGCSLGDVISEFAIFGLGLTIAGATLWAEYIGDYILALALGIAFQYFAIAPMRGLGIRDGLKAATKADFISLSAFEIGLFGWMAIMTFVLFPAPHQLMPSSAAFWFLMQIGMIIGFSTSWPANVWLVNRGIKVPM